jgi:DNA repair photolyase
MFEPYSPSIQSRIKALKMLHSEGVPTYAFIGPVLPLDPGKLLEMFTDTVDEVLIDRLNYSNKVKNLYRKEGLVRYLEDSYFINAASTLREGFEQKGIPVSNNFLIIPKVF